jgi:hypothetical protein
LRRCVLVLSDELLCELPPHQRFRLCVRAQVVTALADNALVEFVQVDVPNANLGLCLETCAVCPFVSIMCLCIWNTSVTYPRFSWNTASSFMKSSYSLVRSMESPRLGAMVNRLQLPVRHKYTPHFSWRQMDEMKGASRAHSPDFTDFQFSRQRDSM